MSQPADSWKYVLLGIDEVQLNQERKLIKEMVNQALQRKLS